MRQTSLKTGDTRAYLTPGLISKAIGKLASPTANATTLPKNTRLILQVLVKGATEQFSIVNILPKLPVTLSRVPAGPKHIVIDRGPGPSSEFMAKVALAASSFNLRRKFEATALRKYGVTMSGLPSPTQFCIAPPPVTSYGMKMTILLQAIKRCYPRTTLTMQILRAFVDTNIPDCGGE